MRGHVVHYDSTLSNIVPLLHSKTCEKSGSGKIDKMVAVMVESDLVQADGLAHSAFNVERLDVLPVLFEEGDEEINA